MSFCASFLFYGFDVAYIYVYVWSAIYGGLNTRHIEPVNLTPGSLLLTGISFDPSMDMYLMPSKVWGEIIYPFLNLNYATVEIWEWISNFIPPFIMDVISYPCWDQKHVSERGPMAGAQIHESSASQATQTMLN